VSTKTLIHAVIAHDLSTGLQAPSALVMDGVIYFLQALNPSHPKDAAAALRLLEETAVEVVERRTGTMNVEMLLVAFVAREQRKVASTTTPVTSATSPPSSTSH
jgi:hypothetical protein